jgi:hypothetical protein
MCFRIHIDVVDNFDTLRLPLGVVTDNMIYQRADVMNYEDIVPTKWNQLLMCKKVAQCTLRL